MRTTILLILWLLPSFAAAHIALTDPSPRTTSQKNGPCGQVTDQRTGNVTVFEPGETITVTWDETINHPSHYRIAFDEDGTNDLVDPMSLDDRYANDAVLLDGIADSDTHTFAVEITLPDIECEACALQLVQVMYDKAPPLCSGCVYGDNDLYYQCADIALRYPNSSDGGPTDDGAPVGGDSLPSDGATLSGDAAQSPGDESAAKDLSRDDTEPPTELVGCTAAPPHRREHCSGSGSPVWHGADACARARVSLRRSASE